MSNYPKIEMTAKTTIQRTTVTRGEVTHFMDALPTPDVDIRMSINPGNQRDAGYTTLEATWTV